MTTTLDSGKSPARVGGTPESFLVRLKRETAHQHLRLEQQLDFLRSDLTLADYIGILANFYGFYCPWEQSCCPKLHEVAPRLCQDRSKTEWLASDLQHFGIDPGSLPICSKLPPLSNPSEWLGSAYVLEGATLGGQILSRHFACSLGLRSDELVFFSGYGEKTGFMWREFCEEFQLQASLANESSVILSAQATFETLGAWLLQPKTS